MAVQRHEEHPPDRPSWAWGELPEPPPPAPAVELRPEPDPVPATPAAPAPPPPVYVVARPAAAPRLLTRAAAHARTGAGGAIPVDRTAARIERVLVMALLAGGWALSLGDRRLAAVLPLVAVALLVSGAHPALSLPRLISARLLPATGLAGPWLTTEDPAPYRLGELVTGLLLLAASLLALVGVAAVAWGLAWAVVVVTLVEFTFDTPVAVMVASRRRPTRPLRA